MTQAVALLIQLFEAYDRGDFPLEPDGRVRAGVNRVARGVTGSLWSDNQVRQYYTLHDGQVSRMDVERLNEPSPTS